MFIFYTMWSIACLMCRYAELCGNKTIVSFKFLEKEGNNYDYYFTINDQNEILGMYSE